MPESKHAHLQHPWERGLAAGLETRVRNKEKKWRRIQQMWFEEVPFPTIAARMDWSNSHLANQTHRMRAAGWDLPLRNEKGKGPRKHPPKKHGRPKGR